MAGLEESLRSGEAQIQEFEGKAGRPQVHAKLRDIWQSEDFWDITIHAQDGQIKAHKLVLSSYCPKLKKQDLDQPNISFNIRANILKLVLSYIYVNKVGIEKDDMKPVAEAAQQLGVEDLYQRCIKAYLSSLPITEDSALKIWVEAADVGVEDITKEALSFALKNFVRIKKKDCFKALSPAHLETYVCHPDLVARSPEERLN